MAIARARSRGRVAPPNLDHLRRIKHAQHGHMLKQLASVPLPAKWDSRTMGWVGPVKDQGGCGSCWDFSGTGTVEIAGNMAGIGGGAANFILSEQYTLDCGKNGGCGGDDNTTVLAWAEATGLPLSAAYGPYTGHSGLFDSCKWSAGMTLYKIATWGFADNNGGSGITPATMIKTAIMTYGSVGCAIAANADFENLNPAVPYTGGGLDQMLDHDIILVGWDDTLVPGNSNFTTVWILRNSWSQDWGGNCGWSGTSGGYCWICDGANQVGTEAVWASFGVTPPTPSPTPTPTPTPTPPAPTPGALPAGTYSVSGQITYTPAAAMGPGPGPPPSPWPPWWYHPWWPQPGPPPYPGPWPCK